MFIKIMFMQLLKKKFLNSFKISRRLCDIVSFKFKLFENKFIYY